MLKIINEIALVFILLLLPLQSNAVDQDTKTVFGSANKIDLIGVSLDDSCSTNNPKILPKTSLVIIIGMKICESKYSQSRAFYKIYWRGDIYYIDKNSLTLNSTDEKKTISYSESDWRQAESDGISISLYLRKAELNELANVINATASEGLAILDWSVIDEGKYGAGVKVQTFNSTKKDIKYIWFTFQGYNPVGDPVGASVKLKAVGPIKSDSSAEYIFEYIWNSNIVENAKFQKIIVQYMDGTQKTIKNPSSIILSEIMLNIFNGI